MDLYINFRMLFQSKKDVMSLEDLFLLKLKIIKHIDSDNFSMMEKFDLYDLLDDISIEYENRELGIVKRKKRKD